MLATLKQTLAIWKEPDDVEANIAFLLEALSICPLDALPDVLRHLRENYKGAFWPKPYDMRKAVEAIMTRRVSDGTDKKPDRPWEKKPEPYTPPTQEEREHVARCMEQIRRNLAAGMKSEAPLNVDKPRHVLPLDGPERERALERMG